MRTARMLFLSSVLVFFWLIHSILKDNNLQNNYFDHLHLRLTGILLSKDVVNGYNGFDILEVKIIHSNKGNYDPRGKDDYYYCIIKDGYAEIYQNGIECAIGDTIEVNSVEQLFTVIKPKEKIVASIRVNTDERYYEYLKKNHQKF